MTTKTLEEFLQELNEANKKTNLPASTFFDYTSIWFHKDKKIFQLYSGSGYNGAYCTEENSTTYMAREADFLPILQNLIQNKTSAINCKALKRTISYRDDSHYDFEYDKDEFVSLGTLSGTISLDGMILELSELKFESFANHGASTNVINDKKFNEEHDKLIGELIK